MNKETRKRLFICNTQLHIILHHLNQRFSSTLLDCLSVIIFIHSLNLYVNNYSVFSTSGMERKKPIDFMLLFFRSNVVILLYPSTIMLFPSRQRVWRVIWFSTASHKYLISSSIKLQSFISKTRMANYEHLITYYKGMLLILQLFW